MATILIAEDTPAINKLMAANLSLVGHSCDQAFTGEQALALAARKTYDLALLDVMLPGVDGFAVKSKLPPDQPVLFVTARMAPDDRLKSLPPEEVLVKPFEVLDLLSRVEKLLRRNSRNTTVFALGDLVVDLNARQVRRGGRQIPLTPQEFALLEALVVNRNLALSREKLLALAWGYDYEGETRTVDVHIQRLRRKLGLEKDIQTVFKVGYRLNTQP